MLIVNGTNVINAGQQQFTDKAHPISLMSGMGEDWWCYGLGQQEVAVDNVKLDISDASPTPTSAPTYTPTPELTPTPTQTAATIPSTPNSTPKPSPSPSPTPKPSPAPSPASTTIHATTQDGVNVNLTLSGNMTKSQISSLAITTDQAAAQTTVSFSLTGQSGTTGLGNITIPKSAVQQGMSPKVYIDEQLAPKPRLYPRR